MIGSDWDRGRPLELLAFVFCGFGGLGDGDWLLRGPNVGSVIVLSCGMVTTADAMVQRRWIYIQGPRVPCPIPGAYSCRFPVPVMARTFLSI